ncbi:MAG: hypothetical protein AB7V77_01405 [Candidatus Woesearchaeota archaeon]
MNRNNDANEKMFLSLEELSEEDVLTEMDEISDINFVKKSKINNNNEVNYDKYKQVNLINSRNEEKINSGDVVDVSFEGQIYLFKKYNNDTILGIRRTEFRTTIIDRNANLVATFENEVTSLDNWSYNIWDAKDKEIGCYCRKHLCSEFHCGEFDLQERKFVRKTRNPIDYVVDLYDELKKNNRLVFLEVRKEEVEEIKEQVKEKKVKIRPLKKGPRGLEYCIEKVPMPEQDRLSLEKEREMLAQEEKIRKEKEQLKNVEEDVEEETKKPVYIIHKSQTEIYIENLAKQRENRNINFVFEDIEIEENNLEDNVEKNFKNKKIYEEIKMNENRRNRETILNELVGLYLSIGPITTAEDLKKSQDSLKDKKSLTHAFDEAIQDIYTQMGKSPDSRIWSVGIDLEVIKTTLDLEILKDSVKCVKNYFNEIGFKSEISEIKTNDKKINDTYKIISVFHPDLKSLEDKVVAPVTSHTNDFEAEEVPKQTERQYKSEINYSERKKAILSMIQEQGEVMQNDVVEKIREKYNVSEFTAVKDLKRMTEEKDIIRTPMPGKGKPLKIGIYNSNNISLDDEKYMTYVKEIKHIIDSGIKSQKRILEIIEQNRDITSKELDYVVKRADKEGYLFRMNGQGFNEMVTTITHGPKKIESLDEDDKQIGDIGNPNSNSNIHKRSYHARKKTDGLNDVDKLILETVKEHSGQKNINQIYKILTDTMTSNNEKPVVQQTLRNRLNIFEKNQYVELQKVEGKEKEKVVIYKGGL